MEKGVLTKWIWGCFLEVINNILFPGVKQESSEKLLYIQSWKIEIGEEVTK